MGNIKHLVGTLCGGTMESPEFYFSGPYCIISIETENNEKQILSLYNQYFNCDYFYGSIIAKLNKISENNYDILEFNDYISKNKVKEILHSNNFEQIQII